MKSLALYDLDKTVLKHASFTPFLIFAARRLHSWRLALLPVWICAMAAYKLRMITRGRLKELGLRLFLGRKIDDQTLSGLGTAFADHIIPAWIGDGAGSTIARDRAAGRDLVLVTAAMQFYAEPIARKLNFDRIIATRHQPITGTGGCRIDGDNCYGAQKVRRVENDLAAANLKRADCKLTFYSDSPSDAPLLDWVDEGVLVDPGASGRILASRRGWTIASFR